MASIWSFLQDDTNRTVLGWVGGGIVVAVTGLWAAFQYVFKDKDKDKDKDKAEDKSGTRLNVTATHGGFAAASISNSAITFGLDTEGVRRLLQEQLAQRSKTKRGEKDETYNGIVRLGSAFAGGPNPTRSGIIGRDPCAVQPRRNLVATSALHVPCHDSNLVRQKCLKLADELRPGGLVGQ
jgi:hypothetical protein